MKIEKLKEMDKKQLLNETLSIFISTIVGIATYVLFLYLHIDIYGWNFGLVVAPLIAGYFETKVANKYLNVNTGAVSSFILFLITVIYGFIIANPTLGFNIITAGSIIIIIQAAIPTATNYFFITIFLALVSHISGAYKKLSDFVYEHYLKFTDALNLKPRITREEESHKRLLLYNKEIDLNNYGVLLLSMDESPKELKILENKGIFESRHVFTYNEREKIKGLSEEKDEKLMDLVKLAENATILKLLKDLKKEECNGLLNFHMTIETLGFSKGENLMQLVIRGTGVVFEKEEEEFLS